MNKYKDNLQLWINDKIKELYGRDTSLVYYDVTNYYFETDKVDDFKKKGVSKEHRTNLSRIKKDYGLGKVVVVADKGMTTGDNIWYTLSAGDGYVFSMSVRGADKELNLKNRKIHYDFDKKKQPESPYFQGLKAVFTSILLQKSGYKLSARLLLSGKVFILLKDQKNVN